MKLPFKISGDTYGMLCALFGFSVYPLVGHEWWQPIVFAIGLAIFVFMFLPNIIYVDEKP